MGVPIVFTSKCTGKWGHVTSAMHYLKKTTTSELCVFQKCIFYWKPIYLLSVFISSCF